MTDIMDRSKVKPILKPVYKRDAIAFPKGPHTCLIDLYKWCLSSLHCPVDDDGDMRIKQTKHQRSNATTIFTSSHSNKLLRNSFAPAVGIFMPSHYAYIPSWKGVGISERRYSFSNRALSEF